MKASALAGITAATFALAACGGGGSGGSSLVPRPPIQTSGAVTFSYAPGFVCCPSPYTISVQPDGTATKTTSGFPPVTVQLTAALSQQIFNDVQQAWPLSSLPANVPVPDAGGLTVAWAAETSPNIVGASSGIEASLNSDAHNLNLAFPP